VRRLKSHPLFKKINEYLGDASQPSNLSYLWNLGSLLAFSLLIQIVTGVTLAMHYNPSVSEAFNSIEHIMRDVNNGWLIRYLHSNTASAFFFIVYLHIGKNIYYSSYKAPRTLPFNIGVVIFICMMATAFLGFLFDISPTCLKFKYNKNNSFKSLNKHIKDNSNINKKYNGIYSISSRTRSFKLKGREPSPGPGPGIINKRKYSTLSTYLNKKLRGNSVTNKASYRLVSKFLKYKKLKSDFIYDDLTLNTIREKIYSETNSLRGIYLILNKVTLDYYIGSASTVGFYDRFITHLCDLTGNKVIKNAVKEYGIDSFAFIILELFPEKVNKKKNMKLLEIEDFYLKSLLPNYNILTEAGSSFDYKHSEITRLKFKSCYNKERRLSLSDTHTPDKIETNNILTMIRQPLISSSLNKYRKEIKNKKKKI
jgi:group I intron endonuclease